MLQELLATIVYMILMTFLLKWSASRLRDTSFDNPLSISLVLGIIFFIGSFIDNLFFSLLTHTIILFLLIKEFYQIRWKTAFYFYLKTMLSLLAIIGLITLGAILF